MHTLPQLTYAYDALEPYIDATTMEIHYTKHHQAYIDKLNAALEAHLMDYTLIVGPIHKPFEWAEHPGGQTFHIRDGPRIQRDHWKIPRPADRIGPGLSCQHP